MKLKSFRPIIQLLADCETSVINQLYITMKVGVRVESHPLIMCVDRQLVRDHHVSQQRTKGLALCGKHAVPVSAMSDCCMVAESLNISQSSLTDGDSSNMSCMDMLELVTDAALGDDGIEEVVL